jgi:hypothetical protein
MFVWEIARGECMLPVRIHGTDRLGHKFDYLTYATIGSETIHAIGLGTLVEVGGEVVLNFKQHRTECRVLSIDISHDSRFHAVLAATEDSPQPAAVMDPRGFL